MVRTNRSNPLTLLDRLPGWLFLLGGMALVVLATLAPLNRDVAYLQRRLDLMRTQQQSLDGQASDYRRFYHALRTDDPTVLGRLAYYHLRLKPSGTQPFEADGDEAVPTIESMLHRPLPSARFEPQAQPASRLARIASGSKRLALLGVGVVCVYVGLLLPVGRGDTDGATAS